MPRYLQARNRKTGETANQIDVTGKPERAVERITRGMLRNMHDDWCVDDYEESLFVGLAPTPGGQDGE